MKWSPKPGVTRFVVLWYRATLFATWALFTAVFASFLERSRDPGTLVFVMLGGAPSVALAVRSLGVAMIEIGPAEVRVRGGFRTHRIPWENIRSVEVGRGSSAALLPFRVPVFELRDGSALIADDFRSLRRYSIVDEVVDELRSRLAQSAPSVEEPPGFARVGDSPESSWGTLGPLDFRTLARLELVGVAAFVTGRWPSAAAGTALVCAMAAAPVSLLAPMAWRNEITKTAYLRYSLIFPPMLLGAIVGAYGAAQGPAFPTSALLMLFGSLYMGAVWLMNGSVWAGLRRLSPWVAASHLGIFGVWADLPRPPGWTCVSFLTYGLFGTLAMHQIAAVAQRETRREAAQIPP